MTGEVEAFERDLPAGDSDGRWAGVWSVDGSLPLTVERQAVAFSRDRDILAAGALDQESISRSQGGERGTDRAASVAIDRC